MADTITIDSLTEYEAVLVSRYGLPGLKAYRRALAEAAEEMDEVTPEVCVSCGTYFNYRGGNQLCGSCRRK